MAKQTLVFESPVELSLSSEMIVINDSMTGEKTLRSIEDVQLVLIDNRYPLEAKTVTNKQSFRCLTFLVR